MAVDLLKALIGANLAAALAVLVVLALRKPARRLAGARLAYALWLIVPLAAIASLLPARSVVALPASVAAIAPQQMAQAVTTLIYDAAPSFDWPALLLGLWLVGAAIAVGLLLWRQHTAIGLLGRLSTQPDGLVRAANAAVGPAVIGLVAPRVVLPADFEARFSPREQALIIAHERSHLKTGDARINAAISLAACLNWINPLLHVAASRLREDQEMACDETVTTAYPGERRAYAEALLKTQVLPIPLPLGCYWPARTPRKLKERIVMLTRKTPGRARRLIGAVAITALATGAGYAAWAAQPTAAAAVSKTAPHVVAIVMANAETRAIRLVDETGQTDATQPHIERKVIIRHAGDDEAIDLSDEPDLAELAAIPGAKVIREVHIGHGDGEPGFSHATARMAVLVGSPKPDVLAKAMSGFPDGVNTVAMTCKISDAGTVDGCIVLPGKGSAAAQAMAMGHLQAIPLKAPAGTPVTILQSFAP